MRSIKVNLDMSILPNTTKLSIFKSWSSLFGIIFFLANQEKTDPNSLASNLASLETWQISPPPRANIRAREGLSIAVSRRLRDSRRARSPSVFLARQVASLCFPAARTHRPRLLVLHRPSRPSLAPTCTERLAAGPGRGHVMICRSGGGGATSDAAVPVGETADSYSNPGRVP